MEPLLKCLLTGILGVIMKDTLHSSRPPFKRRQENPQILIKNFGNLGLMVVRGLRKSIVL